MSISTQPSKCTLYYPSVRKYLKTFDIIAALYYFQKPTTNYFDPINQLTGISSISPNKLQSTKCPLNLFQNKFRNDETIISSIFVTDIFFDVYLGKWNYRAIPKVKTWSYFLTISKYMDSDSFITDYLRECKGKTEKTKKNIRSCLGLFFNWVEKREVEDREISRKAILDYLEYLDKYCLLY